jgi:hypothetical protein
MKYYFDTEFIEDGKTIDLISIGIVAADGREYYAINEDCDFSKASDWVKENVIAKLPQRHPSPPWEAGSSYQWEQSKLWKPKKQIKEEVALFLDCRHAFSAPIPKNWVEKQYWKLPFVNIYNETKFVLKDGIPEPEFWANYSSYDWIVFCQLFGKMIDLPKGFPMYCNDIQQFAKSLGNPELPKQDGAEHNALEDARWVKIAYLKLRCDEVNGVQ